MTLVSKFIKITLSVIIILILPFFSFAQEQEIPLNNLRLDIGLGPGLAGEGGGLSGRAALSYHHSNWGGALRLTAHDGSKGESSGSGFLSFGPPIEKFYEKAILGSYIFHQDETLQYIGKLGYGEIYGECLNDTKQKLVNLKNTPGLAFELSLASYKRTIGWSVNIVGNLNSEATFVAIIISISLGGQF